MKICPICGDPDAIVPFGYTECIHCIVESKDKETGKEITKRRMQMEDEVQAAFFNTAGIVFPRLGKLLYHACNEGKRNPKRTKRIGIKAGVADVHLAVSNGEFHSLFIEFKVGKNKQTDDQIEFQKQVEAAGNKYVVCYAAAEAIEIVRLYLRTTLYK